MSKCYFWEDGSHIWVKATVDGTLHCMCGAEL